MKIVTGNTKSNNRWFHGDISHVSQLCGDWEAAIIILAEHLYAVVLNDLFQPKMSPTLSFSGVYRKSFIYRRNRTNSQ